MPAGGGAVEGGGGAHEASRKLICSLTQHQADIELVASLKTTKLENKWFTLTFASQANRFLNFSFRLSFCITINWFT